MKWLVVLLILFVLIVLLLRRVLANARATPVDPNDPLMLHAIEHARSTFSLVDELLLSGENVAVKFPYQNTEGEIEHVWGGVLSQGDGHVQAVILTPLLAGPTPTDTQTIPVDQVEDWQAFLSDGSGIRGGFTTQAQLAICRREKWPVPKSLVQQEPQFLDSLSSK